MLCSDSSMHGHRIRNMNISSTYIFFVSSEVFQVFIHATSRIHSVLNSTWNVESDHSMNTYSLNWRRFTKKNLTQWGSPIIISILTSYVMVIKNLKISTNILTNFDIKIDVITNEMQFYPPCLNRFNVYKKLSWLLTASKTYKDYLGLIFATMNLKKTMDLSSLSSKSTPCLYNRQALDKAITQNLSN